MAWNGLVLTADGQNTLNSAQLANRMNIKSVVVGDGHPPANFRTLKGLVHQLYEIPELKIDMMEGGKCTLTVDIPKVEYDYYFREIGVIVVTDQGEKLYVYDNCGEDAQFIVSTTGVETTRKRIRLALNIADVAEITVINPDILYVSYNDLENAISGLEQNIENTDLKQQAALDALKTLLTDMINGHLDDKENPHDVDVFQLGLEQVNNTSDMDKPVSTAQQAALDALYQQLTAYTQTKIAELLNGAPTSMDTLKEVSDAIAAHKTVMDALDAAIGKKASAAEFDSHTKDTTKHITAAERTSWNAKMETTGDASNTTTTFTQATSRANLTPKEKLSVSLGKIMKWLADLANGAASTLLGTNLTANRALVSDASGKVGASSVTATELGYLAGLKSKAQDQLNELNTGLGGKANSGHTHTKSQITDFPTSLPASDVAAWAKAASKPTYSWGEITSKPSTFTPASHNHDDRYYTETEINAMLGGANFACYQWIGWGVTILGTAMAYHVGNGTYILKVQGTIIQPSTTNDKFDWGINLTAIRSYAKIPFCPNCIGQWSAYRDGVLLQDFMGYGTAFALKTSVTGYDYLTPGRYYDASVSYAGLWGHNEVIAQPGTFWDTTIILW